MVHRAHAEPRASATRVGPMTRVVAASQPNWMTLVGCLRSGLGYLALRASRLTRWIVRGVAPGPGSLRMVSCVIVSPQVPTPVLGDGLTAADGVQQPDRRPLGAGPAIAPSHQGVNCGM